MKKPFYLIGWTIAWGMIFVCVNAFVTVQFIGLTEGTSLATSRIWWFIAAHGIINMALLAIFSIPIVREAKRSAFGRLISPFDLKFGKRFHITSSLYDEIYDKTYVNFYCGPYPRTATIGGKRPDGATHIQVGGEPANPRFDWIAVSPETVTLLR